MRKLITKMEVGYQNGIWLPKWKMVEAGHQLQSTLNKMITDEDGIGATSCEVNYKLGESLPYQEVNHQSWMLARAIS